MADDPPSDLDWLPRFARDRGRVLLIQDGLAPIVVEGAEAQTFEDLGGMYGRDAQSVYYQGARLAGIAADEVRGCRDGFLIGARAVYFEGDPTTADAASFEALGAYARDRARVYWAEQGDYPGLVVLPDAEPAGFEILGDGYARSGSRGYYHAQCCVPAGAAALRVLGDDVAVTGDAVLFHGRVIAGADPASFVARRALGLARDRHRVYRRVLAGVDPDRFALVAIAGADPGLALTPDVLARLDALPLVERRDDAWDARVPWP